MEEKRTIALVEQADLILGSRHRLAPCEGCPRNLDRWDIHDPLVVSAEAGRPSCGDTQEGQGSSLGMPPPPSRSSSNNQRAVVV